MAAGRQLCHLLELKAERSGAASVKHGVTGGCGAGRRRRLVQGSCGGEAMQQALAPGIRVGS